MIDTQELQTTVSNLSPSELVKFSEWFEEFMANQWDKKIEADILSGRLDTIGKYADDEFIAGRTKPL